MANLKTSIKDVRQNKKRAEINRSWKRRMKNVVKRLNEMIKEGASEEELKKQLQIVYKVVDKVAKRGIIKKNTASRKKSRLSKKVNKALS